jgi:DNA polymerase
LDFETAWDSKNYTLKKMTTEAYIRDPRFKAWGVCAHFYGSEEPVRWIGQKHIAKEMGKIDWSRTAALAHNAAFDVSILSWHYGIQPAFILDTLSMARALRGADQKNNLAALASDFGLPPKGNAVHSTDGMLDSISLEVEKELAEYCKHDVYLCEQIFARFSKGYPTKELRLIDMTLRMFTRPLLELDQDMLLDALLEEKEEREALLTRLSLKDEDLSSNNKFAEVLTLLGVPPPTKKKNPTPKTPNPVGTIFAFAKTDAMFQAMLNGDNADVALVCEARLKVKSTSERTRAQRFSDIAKRGPLPVPLHYFGTGTGRWAAMRGEAINMQNLKRGSFLRKAIMAPKGHMLVVGDLSQIEPRVLAWMADYEDMMDIFRAKGDPYGQFGAQMFGVEGLSKESHPALRQSAKSALLGCGYQMGWASFAAQLLVGFLGAPPVRYDRAFADQLGVTKDYAERFIDWEDNLEKMEAIPHVCTTKELLIHCLAAKKIIDIYRATAHPVTGFWELCQHLIQKSLADGEEHTHKCLLFRKGEIVLPNGMSLLYPELRQQKQKSGRPQWVYGPNATKLYAGKIVNNVVQGTARIVMTDGMLRTAARYPVVGTVHDEQIVVVPEVEAPDALEWTLKQMTLEPVYMPGIPLAADGGFHRRYGLAKN